MSLYAKMAARNVRNNYRFFVPRILTEAGMLACFYIVFTLFRDERMSEVPGGAYLPSFMAIGTVVIGLLSVILMLYSSSFLMKQRRREFGLYNVLGLEKRHAAKVLFHESAFSSVSGIVLGIFVGILFYKLCSLFICRLLGVESVLGFYYISPGTVLASAVFFLLIDLFTYGVNCVSIARMKPVELMASAHTGEKEPKVKWLMLVLGVLCLGGGYFLSIATRQPLRAMVLFFAAVILVIIGTYFLFVTGTIFVLKRLKGRKKYYYERKHMTAVSGLLYRMKQNAVGLASICILSTGVLVMISTTVSMYAGAEEALERKYPKELYLTAQYTAEDGRRVRLSCDDLAQLVTEAAAGEGLEIRSVEPSRYLGVSYRFEDGVCRIEPDRDDMSAFTYLYFMTADDYRAATGEEIALGKDEVAFCMLDPYNDTEDFHDVGALVVAGKTYRVARRLSAFPVSIARYGIVVRDGAVLDEIDREQREAYGDKCSDVMERLCVSFADREAARKQGFDLDRRITDGLRRYAEAQPDHADEAGSGIWSDSLWDYASGVYGIYGTFLFLGILLGLVCLFAAVLIIYYKQISEGYEDRERYQIMEKIGMSQKEVRESVRSQVLLVFFLPLLTAGVHIVFAFPILTRLLRLLELTNVGLFVLCAVLTFLVFTLVYAAIYTVTSRTYYKIVH